MTSSARIRPQAAADIDQHFLYIADNNSDAAHRFLTATRRSIDILAENPDMGTLWEFVDSDLPTILVWPVRGFRNHILFYQVNDDGVEIVRVLHGARDVDSEFHSESG